VVFCKSVALEPRDFPFFERADQPRSSRVTVRNDGLDSLVAGVIDLPFREAKQRALVAFETAYLTALLERTGGNVSEAARQAGLDRSNFRRTARRAGLKWRDSASGNA
jgi:DNA-binding NtrC family response regulator